MVVRPNEKSRQSSEHDDTYNVTYHAPDTVRLMPETIIPVRLMPGNYHTRTLNGVQLSCPYA